MIYPVKSNSGEKKLNELPSKCPFCHKSVTPNILWGHQFDNNFEVFFYCPDGQCCQTFIGYYQYSSTGIYQYIGKTSSGNLTSKKFNDSIIEVSPDFNIIYNEAFVAEQQNLTEICGVGYRKALEFLIKDYAILKNTTEKEKILKMRLANCIKEYVNDERVKSVSKRAVWLGNDETHYVRKWETKNLQDLKKLIDLTVHWIEMEKLTESFESEMPE